MNKKYQLKNHLPKLNIFEKILAIIFEKYTFKVYRKGFQDGLNLKK